MWSFQASTKLSSKLTWERSHRGQCPNRRCIKQKHYNNWHVKTKMRTCFRLLHDDSSWSHAYPEVKMTDKDRSAISLNTTAGFKHHKLKQCVSYRPVPTYNGNWLNILQFYWHLTILKRTARKQQQLLVENFIPSLTIFLHIPLDGKLIVKYVASTLREEVSQCRE